MKVLIVEDEPSAADFLQHLIQKVDRSIEVLAIVDSIQSSTDWFRANPNPDLAFMDIQLSDGLSFEIFERVEVRCPVIFTTAYEEYAIRAFRVNSIDYLLKPIDPKQLAQSLEKFRNLSESSRSSYPNDLATKLAGMVDEITRKHKSRFLVSVGPHLRTVNSSDIECFYSMEKSTFMVERNGKHYDVEYSLDQLEKIINPLQFFRVNRKYLVNRDFVVEIVVYSVSRLKLKLTNYAPDDLLVSQKRVSEFKKWLEE